MSWGNRVRRTVSLVSDKIGSIDDIKAVSITEYRAIGVTVVLKDPIAKRSKIVRIPWGAIAVADVNEIPAE